jgi:uncharacterized protein (TIGR03437 family)
MFRVQFTKMAPAALLALGCAGMLQAQTASPLTALPAAPSLTFQKPSTAGSAVPVKITATASTYFTIDPVGVPFWLTLGATSGTANATGVNVSFTPNAVGGSLGAGSYGGSVHFKVTGFADLVVPVTLVVSDPAPTVTIAEGTTQTISWGQGSPYPSSTLTVTSSGTPVNFAAVAAVTAPTSPAAWLKVNHSSGVAYSWGTPIAVTFTQAVFDGAAVGDALTGTVSVTPSGGSAIVVNYTINVTSPTANITSIYPSETATQATAASTDPALTVVVTGTGFVPSPSNKKTVVTVGTTALDTAAVTVISSTTMLVTVTPDNFNAAGPLAISAQNPSIGTASSVNLTVTDNPIVYSLTDGASLVQAAPGTNPSVAPFEIATLFGDNFGPTGSTLLTASLNSFSRYPTKLSTSDPKDIIVTFYKADGTTLIGAATMLFATKTQINLMVPSGVAGNTTVKYTVSFDTNVSQQYTANVATSNPGIFTSTSSGTGQGAILHAADYSANSTTNKAAKGSTVLLYLSGLGAPNSTAANTASTTAPAFPAACVSLTAYMGSVNSATTHPSPAWTTLDGAVILSSKLATNHFAPCFASPIAVTATIDGKAATVTYAGWVADSVAGLYQINATVPTTATSGNAIAVVVNVGTAHSQTGVTMAIQ